MLSALSSTSLLKGPYNHDDDDITEQISISSSSTTPNLVSTPSSSHSLSSSSYSSSEAVIPIHQALQLAKTACPAFQNDNDPFQGVSDNEGMQNALRGLPPSHIMVQEQWRLNGDRFRLSERSLQNSLLDGGEDSDAAPSPVPLSAVEKTHTTAPQSQTPPPSNPSLSEALKSGTTVSHASAESVHFVKRFIAGDINRDLYAQLILDLYHVYATLERELDTHAPLHFSGVHFPRELGRVESLRDDVEFFFGDGYLESGAAGVQPTQATRDYVERLEQIAKKDPILLLAHAYTRYLGDLSGGKVLARVARKALHLQSSTEDDDADGGDDGLRFYHFESIPSPVKFKNQYRAALDALPLPTEPSSSSSGHSEEEIVERIVAEANVAFVLNMRIFEELDVMGGIKGSSVRPLEDAVGYFTKCVDFQKERRRRIKNGDYVRVEEEKVEAKCPFAMLGGPFNGPNPHADETDVMVDKKDNSVDEEMGSGGGRCPWPFVFFHDPITGMRDYQTWIVILLISFWLKT